MTKAYTLHKSYLVRSFTIKPKTSWTLHEINRAITQTLGYIEKIRHGYYNLSFTEEQHRLTEAEEVLAMWEKRLQDLTGMVE